jgi:hypothetical protein
MLKAPSAASSHTPGDARTIAAICRRSSCIPAGWSIMVAYSRA